MRHRRNIVLAVLCAAELAGCGAVKSSSPTAAYRARIQRICTTSDAEIEALRASTSATIPGLERLSTIQTRALNELQGIKPPASLSAKVEGWLGQVTGATEATTTLINNLRSGETTTPAAIAQADAPLAETADGDARALGLPRCAVNAEPKAS